MRSPSRSYARRNAAYSSSVPRSVRSPFTTTASGASRSISSIAPRFRISGYGSVPGAAVNTGPAACNGANTVASYAVQGNPLTAGSTGTRWFFTNGATIYQSTTAVIAPVQVGAPATGNPIQ